MNDSLNNNYNHIFIKYPRFGDYYYKCTICNLIVYETFSNVIAISDYNDWKPDFTRLHILNISCDEVIIKAIIE